jgi:hypothetical protein
MKKIVIVMALSLLAVGIYAGSTNTYTNVYNQVVTVVSGDNGVTTTTITPANTAATEVQSFPVLAPTLLSYKETMVPARYTSSVPGTVLINVYSQEFWMASRPNSSTNWAQLITTNLLR